MEWSIINVVQSNSKCDMRWKNVADRLWRMEDDDQWTKQAWHWQNIYARMIKFWKLLNICFRILNVTCTTKRLFLKTTLYCFNFFEIWTGTAMFYHPWCKQKITSFNISATNYFLQIQIDTINNDMAHINCLKPNEEFDIEWHKLTTMRASAEND